MSLKALIALVPASLLFSGSLVLFFREKTVSSLLQLLGSACLVVVVLSHVCEAFHLFPSMHFGREHSVGIISIFGPPFLDSHYFQWDT
jgi:hypothetical protein